MSKKSIGIFLFRKDFRIQDNLALHTLSTTCSTIFPIFIFDPFQVESTVQNQHYRSTHAIQFMCESLMDLHIQTQKKLTFYYGSPSMILQSIFRALQKSYETIYLAFNLDFSKYAIQRDTTIQKICSTYRIQLITNDHDHTLIPFEYMLKKDKTAYLVYNAFYENAKKTSPATPITKKIQFCTNPIPNITTFSISSIKKLYQENPHLAQRGGRTIALRKLNNSTVYKQYTEKRDMLDFHTFEISAALNFGCISIRECYAKMKSHPVVARQLYWRDFYHCILRYTPFANQYTRCISKEYDLIKWKPDVHEWKALMEAKTGFLMIDAGMRELRTTGYIGNRMRLILGSFWIKYLRIHPLHPIYGSTVGYSMFLVDCNTSQNKLNHQWLLELDRYRFAPKKYRLAGRPFRIDNEMIQKYDKQGIYIKKWLPELAHIPIKELYHWDERMYHTYKKVHPFPIFNWKERYAAWLASTKNL